jgi:hypothetical protein
MRKKGAPLIGVSWGGLPQPCGRLKGARRAEALRRMRRRAPRRRSDDQAHELAGAESPRRAPPENRAAEKFGPKKSIGGWRHYVV